MSKLLPLAQGAYFFLSGVWPMLSPRTFQKVTGPKREFWLVNTVGAVVMAIGAVLLRSARAKRPSGDAAALGLLSAAALGAIEVTYVARRRISKVYLLDAMAEAGFVAAWSRFRSRK